jgi:hypothetical protein
MRGLPMTGIPEVPNLAGSQSLSDTKWPRIRCADSAREQAQEDLATQSCSKPAPIPRKSLAQAAPAQEITS